MDISLQYFEEVYTTEHWMVRVYRVLDKRALPRGTTHPCRIKCKSPHGSATCSPTNGAHAHVYDNTDALLLVLGAHLGSQTPWYPAVLNVGSAVTRSTLSPHATLP